MLKGGLILDRKAASQAPSFHLMISQPKRDFRAVLLNAPPRVQLWFNERLEPQFSHLSVWNREGKQVDRGDVQVGPDDLKLLPVGGRLPRPRPIHRQVPGPLRGRTRG